MLWEKRTTRVRLFIFPVIFIFFFQIALAAGERDPNFGTNGTVIINFGNVHNSLRDAVLQPDGKIVMVGTTAAFGGQESFALARLKPDGTFDETFGTNGKVISNLDGLNTPETAMSVLIQPDGKILVGGSASVVQNNAQHDVFALVRYHANGSLDSSFGTGGIVYTAFEGGGSNRISKILLMADGKILAFAEYHAAFNISRILVVRYRTDGYEDNTLGRNSRMFIDSPQRNIRFDDAALQPPDDRILISGRINYTYLNCQQNCQGSVPFLTRYSAGFVLDRKFGRRNGRETSLVFDQFTSISVLSDGSLAVGGERVRRFNANGRFLSNFTQVEETNERASRQPDGKFAGCGSLGIGTLNRDVIATLHNENGTIIGTDRIDIGSQDFCSDVLSQADGKFLIGGTAFRLSGNASDFFVVRYLNITP